MAKAKGGLGRGLGALLPEYEEIVEPTEEQAVTFGLFDDSGAVSEEDEAKMKETIVAEICGKAGELSKNLSVIATCAEKKVTRSGETKPFGKEDVCESILPSPVIIRSAS